jgi:hypothetical protein
MDCKLGICGDCSDRNVDKRCEEAAGREIVQTSDKHCEDAIGREIVQTSDKRCEEAMGREIVQTSNRYDSISFTVLYSSMIGSGTVVGLKCSRAATLPNSTYCTSKADPHLLWSFNLEI